MKIERRTMWQRGQIVVPKKLRERFNFKPGKRVIFEVKNNAIILKPEGDPESFVKDFVSVPSKKLKKINMAEIKKTLEDEYEVH
jgi:AbrB family looped-hinge helix DNA binding protein